MTTDPRTDWAMQTYDVTTGYSKWYEFADQGRLTRAARRAYDRGTEILFCGHTSLLERSS